MRLLYEEIARKIELFVKDKKYTEGSKLPGEKKLATEFNVARPTVHKAIELLAGKGLIESRPSVGNFILKRPKEKLLYAYAAPDLSDPFHAEFISAFNRVLTKSGGSLIVDDNSKANPKQIIQRFQDENVDGLIYCNPGKDDSIYLQDSVIPVVWFASKPKMNSIDYVVMNNTQGIETVLKHFHESGIKKVGYIEGSTHTKRSIRKEAFLKNYERFKMECRDEWFLEINSGGEKGGRELFAIFKELKNRPEAVVCYNDWNAIGFIEEALDYGIKIPDDLRVTGFDNLMISQFYKVPLTTVDCNITSLAEKCFEILQNRIKQPGMKVQRYIGDCKIVVRNS